MSAITVSTADELANAIADGFMDIRVEGTIAGSPSITLPESATLSGGTLEFTGKGVRLTRNNALKDITITTVDYEVAVYNDTSIDDAGTLVLHNVTTVGQIYLVADDNLRRIRVEADQVHVKAADVRGRSRQPHGFGVDVLQGGLTLWNLQPDADTEFTATLKGINIGTPLTPVRGSGVFLDGYTDREGKLTGGALRADVLETGTVITDGGIVQGTGDKITGAVFVLGGAVVDRVENNGATVTHGANDMALDLWGKTLEWVANAPVTTTGASGIGFVNFGQMGRLEINAPIATTGLGARGFNVYDGSVESATFDSITTHGDGAIGIQVSKPTGPIVVRGDVRTTGGEGMSLVKGVQMKLKATAVSIKPGAEVASLKVGGTVATGGADLVTFEVLEGGSIGELSLGEVTASGSGSVATKIDGDVPENDQR